MDLTVTIGGVAMTGDAHFVDEGSPSHVNAIGQRDTFSCRIVSADGSYRPAIGASVEVSDDAGVRFGGSIRELNISQFGAALVAEIQCASWEAILDRRLVGQSSYNNNAGDIFTRLCIDYLEIEGLTSSIVLSGPPIQVTFDWCTVREAFDKICELASDSANVYMWDVTPSKVVRFYRQNSFAAPFNVTATSSEVLRPITLNQSFGGSGVGYANKVRVRVGRFITDPRANEYDPTGTLDTLSFELPIAQEPTVTLAGVEQTIGIRGADAGKQCYWQDGSPDITFTTNPVGHVVITAQGYQTTVIDGGQDDDEVAARSIAEDNSGWYEVLVELSDGKTTSDAMSAGAATLADKGKVPNAIEYVTTTNGVKAGQYQTINLPFFGVNTTFVIESVQLFQAGPNYGWRVRAVNGSLANGWLQKLRQIATGSTAGVSGTGGTVITPGANPLVLTAALPSATVGIGYVGPLIAIGGQTPYTFSIHSGTLPSWATLDTATGVISGTPTYAGTTTFTARVTDSVGTTQDYDCTLVVVAAAVGGGTGAIPPNNVTIDSVEADAKPLTGSAVRGTRNSVAKRGITIRYTPPDVTYVPSAITFAQGKSLALGWGYVSSVGLTLDASVSTGQLILVAIRWDSDYSLPLSVSDSAGNSYTLIDESGRSSAGWYHQAVYYAYATSSGTVTISGSWTGGDGFSPSISAAVFSGASGAPEATDVTEVSYSGTSSIASGSLTPAETGCAIVSFAGSNGAITFSGAGGSLLASQTATDHAIGCTYQVLSSTAAVTNGVGYVSGDAYVGVLTTVLFRAATTASSTFRGVYVQVEAPDQTTAYATRGGRPGRFLDGSLALSAVDLSGPRAPYTFGPFPHSETDGSLRVQIPEPDASQLPMNARARVISYSDDVTNSADTSPSQTFIIADPTASKPNSGTAYAPNPQAIRIPATVPGTGIRNTGQPNPYTVQHGTDETHLWVDLDLDPRAFGYQLILKNPDGDSLNASGVETAPHFEMVFTTPSSVGVYTLYALGSDGTNINPLIPGITPSATVTLGTDDGTVDLGRTTPSSRGRGLDVVDDALGIVDEGVTEACIAALAVSAAKIAAGAVETAKIADLSIVTSKLAASAVNASKLADLAVEAAKLADSSVTATKIANAAVGTAAIANLAVGNAHIQNGAITNAKIGNLAVGTAQIQDAAITTAKITNLAITSALIADAAITTAKIGDAQITSAKISSLAVDKLTAGTMTSTGLGAGLLVQYGSDLATVYPDQVGCIHGGGSALLSAAQTGIAGQGGGLNLETASGAYLRLRAYNKTFDMSSGWGVFIGGSTAQTTTISYMKPGGTTGTMTFTNGWLTGST